MIRKSCWMELHLLGLRIGREQCWSNQASAVSFRSLKLVVETIPLKDSNNGLIIMLNCRPSNVKGDNKEGVQNILRERLWRRKHWISKWTSTARGTATFQKLYFQICNTKTKKKNWTLVPSDIHYTLQNSSTLTWRGKKGKGNVQVFPLKSLLLSMYVSQKTARVAVTAESTEDFLQYNNLARKPCLCVAFYFPVISHTLRWTSSARIHIHMQMWMKTEDVCYLSNLA